jgi:hypothetical protein
VVGDAEARGIGEVIASVTKVNNAVYYSDTN